MHTVRRPASEPVELAALRRSGDENFGSLNRSLDNIFGGVCAYCERLPLWRMDQEGLGIEDTDLPDVPGQLFTCDHLKPRRLLCNDSDPDVGQCQPTTPPHTLDCTIYGWDNLVYVCPACAGVKGGLWPRDGDNAVSYVDPCADPGSECSPDTVFAYELDTGRIVVRAVVTGSDRTNALQTIADLALNFPREPIETRQYHAGARRVSLADLRRQWVRRLVSALEQFSNEGTDILRFLVAEFTHTSSRFSSICRQFIQESQYSHYLT